MNIVHIEGVIINTVVTSKEAILHICRDIVKEKGINSLNMRDVSERCQIALGTLYNYFDSKTALVVATIESVWSDAFAQEQNSIERTSFIRHIDWLFKTMQKAMKKYPNFLSTHSLIVASEIKGEGKEKMYSFFKRIQDIMWQVLKSDNDVKNDAFHAQFCEEDFIELVFNNLLLLTIQKKSSDRILVEMIKKTIY